MAPDSNLRTRRPTGGATIRVLLTRRERSVDAPWVPIRRVLKRVLADHQQSGALSVVFVGDREIAEIHEEFLGDDRPTDVISFPYPAEDHPEGEETVIGEVVLSVETARREAARRGIPVPREVALYAIHGALHIVGFDDRDAAGRREMRRLERRYLGVYRECGGE